MDMNADYELEVRRHRPQAAIVFDLFHVMAKYGREVIDRVRVDRANELRTNRPQRRLVKSARWLLLKSHHRLRPEEDVQLEDLLAADRPLFIVYLLRDALRELWHHRHPGDAARPGPAGTARPCAAVSHRCASSPSACGHTSRGSWSTADIPSAPTSSRASTTASRSSSE